MCLVRPADTISIALRLALECRVGSLLSYGELRALSVSNVRLSYGASVASVTGQFSLRSLSVWLSCPFFIELSAMRSCSITSTELYKAASLCFIGILHGVFSAFL